LIDLLVDTVSPLEAFPLMGVERSELAPGLRAVTSRNYILFYRDLPGRVRVERVLHGRRDIDAIYF
jgi:toxin ParE1/3/4